MLVRTRVTGVAGGGGTQCACVQYSNSHTILHKRKFFITFQILRGEVFVNSIHFLFISKFKVPGKKKIWKKKTNFKVYKLTCIFKDKRMENDKIM